MLSLHHSTAESHPETVNSISQVVDIGSVGGDIAVLVATLSLVVFS